MINKYILCSHYFISAINIWSFVTIPFNHEWENQSGHLREDNMNNYLFFYAGEKTKLCSDTVEKVTEQIQRKYSEISHLSDRQHVTVDNLSDFLVSTNTQ